MKGIVFLALVAAAASHSGMRFKNMTIAPMNDNIDEASGLRYRRSISNSGGSGNAAVTGVSSELSGAEKATTVLIHNRYRAAEDSDAELELQNDDGLASLAQAWANECNWEHGMLYDFDGNRMGQNMFMSGGGTTMPPLDTEYAIEQWFNEKQWYHYNDMSCDAGKMCGHYTQVVWAKTRSVGCAVKKCPTVTVGDNIWTNAIIYVCNYSPAGNVQGQKIYEKGPQCSKCDRLIGGDSGYKCVSNLCVPCVPRDDPSCSCGPNPPTCQNGGTYSNDDCSCMCPEGYYGRECENSCTCENVYPDEVCIGWSSFCSQASYRDFMKSNCPVTCNMCDLPAECNS